MEAKHTKPTSTNKDPPRSSLPTSFPHMAQKELIDPLRGTWERRNAWERAPIHFCRRCCAGLSFIDGRSASFKAEFIHQTKKNIWVRSSNFIRSSMGRRKRDDAAEKSWCAFGPVIHLHHLISEHQLLFNFIALISLIFMPTFTPVRCLHVRSVCYCTAASLSIMKSNVIQSQGYFPYFPSIEKEQILLLLTEFRLSGGLAFQVRPSGKVVTGKSSCSFWYKVFRPANNWLF